MRKFLIRTTCGLMLALAMIFAGAPFAPASAAIAPRATAQRDRFIVPDNTLLEATLNKRLNAGSVRDGRRFTMTVTSPNEYRGARIEGYVSQVQRSGRVRGTSEMTLNFDRIRLNGRTYDFAGSVESARTTRGEQIDVDREGGVQEESQTERTVGRTTVGAVAGTVIGAIAGGGSGAAKGAIIGGGLGAGSVLAQGLRNLDLRAGTRMTIRASAPR